MNNLDIYDFPEFKRPLVQAIKLAGGKKDFSKALNITPQTLHAWLYILEKGVPPKRCIEVENATEGRITRQQLRPDIYGEDLNAPVLTIEEELNQTMRKLQILLKEIYVDKGRITVFSKPKKGVK